MKIEMQLNLFDIEHFEDLSNWQKCNHQILHHFEESQWLLWHLCCHILNEKVLYHNHPLKLDTIILISMKKMNIVWIQSAIVLNEKNMEREVDEEDEIMKMMTQKVKVNFMESLKIT